MGKFDFNRANDDTLNVSMSKQTGDAIREIAKNENVTIQEVCRKFLEVSLADYLTEKEQP